MKEFLISYYTPIIHLVEILAAISGSIYFYKSRDNTSRFFVYYLWLVVVVETFALYARFMPYNFDNEWFVLIKNSSFCTNHWLYNLYSLILVFLLSKYFKNIIVSLKSKRLIDVITYSYLACSALYLVYSDSFFGNGIPFGFMIRTLIISFFACLYYLDTLKSDNLLTFYKSRHFYLITALLLWSLAITPLFIFQSYYSYANPNFLYLRQFILLCANIIMYLCFTIVFLISYFKTK